MSFRFHPKLLNRFDRTKRLTESARAVLGRRRFHSRTGVSLAAHYARRLQLPHRSPDRGSADGELLGQFELVRQQRADGIAAVGYRLHELPSDVGITCNHYVLPYLRLTGEADRDSSRKVLT